MPISKVYGVIEEGKLKGKRVILRRDNDPVTGKPLLPDNLFLVEKGTFLGGAPMFALHCLKKGCEAEIPSPHGCPKHNNTTESLTATP